MIKSSVLLTDIIQVQKMIEQNYQIFYYCRLIAILCGGGAAILFLVFEIPKVLGELTGITAKKKIKAFQRKNASTVQYMQKNFCGVTTLQDIKDNNETIMLDEEFKTQLLEDFALFHKET